MPSDRFVVRHNEHGWYRASVVDSATGCAVRDCLSAFEARQYADDFNADEDARDLAMELAWEAESN
jgi:hypothetical protein